MRSAYNKGKDAKETGKFRVSPYYGKEEYLDKYWYAGYDGIPFETIK
jgi:hypothetical protein